MREPNQIASKPRLDVRADQQALLKVRRSSTVLFHSDSWLQGEGQSAQHAHFVSAVLSLLHGWCTTVAAHPVPRRCRRARAPWARCATTSASPSRWVLSCRACVCWVQMAACTAGNVEASLGKHQPLLLLPVDLSLRTPTCQFGIPCSTWRRGWAATAACPSTT